MQRRSRRLFQVAAAIAVPTTMLLAGTGVSASAGLRRLVTTPSAAAATQAAQPPSSPAVPAAPASAPAPSPVAVGGPVPRSFDGLAAQIAALESANGAHLGLSLIELGGADPQSWNFQGGDAVVAASTYKLPVLMVEAEAIAAGRAQPTDQVCYSDTDWEDGWFQDYTEGACYSLQELAGRIGQDSDNTAAHMLVRSLGGTDVLNAYAAGRGATGSAFYDPNTTTANDLARLMAAEATGTAGGNSAQAWLYPLLTHTEFESGIPSGVPASATVVHKTGELDSVTNDVGLVEGGPNGAYVVAICVDGPGGDAGFSVIAELSTLVWQLEAGR